MGEIQSETVLQAAHELEDVARRIRGARGVLATVLNPPAKELARLNGERSRLSTPSPQDQSAVTVLGRSLWGDYLVGVEIAGSLLLIATVGAIVINARQREAAA
jgi:NADH:ubiquinone oxidoreductase subunit 6 (subunit J)